jgi:DNA-binding MarR family transcriptional regulator
MNCRLSDLVRSRICGGAGRRSVLRALADNTDDRSEVSRSVPELAREAEVTDRTVQTHLKAFVAEGLAVRAGERPNASGRKVVVYKLVEAAIAALPCALSGEAAAPVKPQHRNSFTGETIAPVKNALKPQAEVSDAETTTRYAGETFAPGEEIKDATYIESSLSQDDLSPEVEEVSACARGNVVSLFEPEALPVKKRTRRANEGSFIDPGWMLTGEDAAYAASNGFVNGTATAMAEAFKNHWLSASGTKARKRDWHAAWRTWVNNQILWKGKPDEQQRPGAAAADAGVRQRPRSRLTQRFNEIQARSEPLELGRLDSHPVK